MIVNILGKLIEIKEEQVDRWEEKTHCILSVSHLEFLAKATGCNEDSPENEITDGIIRELEKEMSVTLLQTPAGGWVIFRRNIYGFGFLVPPCLIYVKIIRRMMDQQKIVDGL